MDPADNFKIKTDYLSEKVFSISFRFDSPGSIIRFEKLINDRLKLILIYAKQFSVRIPLNVSQQEAFKKMFALSYPSNIHDSENH